MKKNFLFPHKLKKLGWLLFVPSLIIGTILRVKCFPFEHHLNIKVFALVSDEIFSKETYFSIIQNSVLDEIFLILIIIGGILVGFSKVKNEDELISKIRYESLVWATYFNFGIMLLATFFVYGGIYFDVLIANVFSMLFFFIIRFHYMLYNLQKSIQDEE